MKESFAEWLKWELLAIRWGLKDGSHARLYAAHQQAWKERKLR